MDSEETLIGGNSATVTRVGDTVRRESGPWARQVQMLLSHLRARGIQEVPEPLGFDEQGREILAFIPGRVGHYPLPESLRSDRVLISAARLLRRIHDATLDLAQTLPSGWQSPTRTPLEVICHGDFAPYNCVFDGDSLVGVIDFDHAHAGDRDWDVAYAMYRFVPITDPSNPDHYGTLDEQCRRARLFCDAYGMQNGAQLVQTIKERVAHMADYLRQGAASGNQRLQQNIDAGHLAVYTADYAYLERCEERFRRALDPASRDDSTA